MKIDIFYQFVSYKNQFFDPFLIQNYFCTIFETKRRFFTPFEPIFGSKIEPMVEFWSQSGTKNQFLSPKWSQKSTFETETLTFSVYGVFGKYFSGTKNRINLWTSWTPYKFITPKYKNTPKSAAIGSFKYFPQNATRPIKTETPIVVTRCSMTSSTSEK